MRRKLKTQVLFGSEDSYRTRLRVYRLFLRCSYGTLAQNGFKHNHLMVRHLK